MPLLAAGFGLAIIGSVGTIGPTLNFGFAAGAAPASAPVNLGTSGAPANFGGAPAPTPSAKSDNNAPGVAGQAATASPGAARAEDASGSPAAERQGRFSQQRLRRRDRSADDPVCGKLP